MHSATQILRIIMIIHYYSLTASFIFVASRVLFKKIFRLWFQRSFANDERDVICLRSLLDDNHSYYVLLVQV